MSSHICEKYFFYFHLLGLGYYNPHTNDANSNGFAQFRKSVPAICLLSFAVLNSVLSFHKFARLSSLTNFLYAVFIVLKLITVLVAFKRASFLREDTKLTWKYLINLEVLIKNRLNLEIHFQKFSKRYRGKLFCVMIFFIGWFAVKVFYRLNSTNTIRQLAVFNLTLITLGINFHILFYVDLFSFFMETINQRTMNFITSDQALISDHNHLKLSEKIIHLFRILKFIHFKLWKIVQVMNDDLGSVLTVLIINSANTSILTFYWIIIELEQDDWSVELHLMSTFHFHNYERYLDVSTELCCCIRNYL